MVKKLILNKGSSPIQHKGLRFNTEFIKEFIKEYPPETYNLYDIFYLKSPYIEQEDIPVEVIINWRFNEHLIDFIEKYIDNYNYKFNACDSNYDIIYLDDIDSEIFSEDDILDSIEIECGNRYLYSARHEILNLKYKPEFIIKELKNIIINNIEPDNLKKYIDKNKITNLTKDVLSNNYNDFDDINYYKKYD